MHVAKLRVCQNRGARRDLANEQSDKYGNLKKVQVDYSASRKKRDQDIVVISSTKLERF